MAEQTYQCKLCLSWTIRGEKCPDCGDIVLPIPNTIPEIEQVTKERSYLSGNDGASLRVVDMIDIIDIFALAIKGELPRIKE